MAASRKAAAREYARPTGSDLSDGLDEAESAWMFFKGARRRSSICCGVRKRGRRLGNFGREMPLIGTLSRMPGRTRNLENERSGLKRNGMAARLRWFRPR